MLFSTGTGRWVRFILKYLGKSALMVMDAEQEQLSSQQPFFLVLE